MYAKVESGAITQYPYGLGHLKRDNPNVSFPKDILSTDGRDAYNVVEVAAVEKPSDATDVVTEGTPTLISGVWTQNWIVTPKTDAQKNEDVIKYRKSQYGKPEAQLEYITENGLDAWQTKVAEIKAANPKV